MVQRQYVVFVCTRRYGSFHDRTETEIACSGLHNAAVMCLPQALWYCFLGLVEEQLSVVFTFTQYISMLINAVKAYF